MTAGVKISQAQNHSDESDKSKNDGGRIVTLCFLDEIIHDNAAFCAESVSRLFKPATWAFNHYVKRLARVTIKKN
jgi:hypothetical protein